MTHIKIVQDQQVFFSWEVLYFSFLGHKIILEKENWNYLEIPLINNWEIYKNWKLRYKYKKSYLNFNPELYKISTD